jgi:hypothetical protein
LRGRLRRGEHTRRERQDDRRNFHERDSVRFELLIANFTRTANGKP